MAERETIISQDGRIFEIPVNLLPGFETFAKNTLEKADTEFRDTVCGDVAVGLVAKVFGDANRGATHEEQLEKMQNFIDLATQRSGNAIIPFLRDELGLSLALEELALIDS